MVHPLPPRESLIFFVAERVSKGQWVWKNQQTPNRPWATNHKSDTRAWQRPFGRRRRAC